MQRRRLDHRRHRRRRRRRIRQCGDSHRSPKFSTSFSAAADCYLLLWRLTTSSPPPLRGLRPPTAEEEEERHKHKGRGEGRESEEASGGDSCPSSAPITTCEVVDKHAPGEGQYSPLRFVTSHDKRDCLRSSTLVVVFGAAARVPDTANKKSPPLSGAAALSLSRAKPFGFGGGGAAAERRSEAK